MIDVKAVQEGKRSKWERGVAAYKAQDGAITWYAKVPVHGRARVFKLENCANVTQARIARDELRRKHHRKKYAPDTEHVTVREFFPEFIAAKKTKIGTWKKYNQQMEDFWLPAIGSSELSDVTAADVERHLARLKEAGNADGSVRSYAACLRAFFGQARKARKTTNNPMHGADVPPPAETEKPGLLGKVAIAAAGADKRDDDMRMLFWLLFHTGKRIAHAVRMRWTDADFDAGLVTGQPDKRGRAVLIPLHKKLRAELLRHKAKQRWASPWVFASHRVHKKRRPRRALRRMQGDWNDWMEELGIELTRHDMRHAFITRMDAAGATPKQIQTMTGQKTTKVTIGYTHPELETLRKLVES